MDPSARPTQWGNGQSSIAEFLGKTDKLQLVAKPKEVLVFGVDDIVTRSQNNPTRTSSALGESRLSRRGVARYRRHLGESADRNKRTAGR
jgi:hypothetical protein